MSEVKKVTINLISGEQSKSGKSYIYKAEDGTVYISKEKYPEGVGEYFVSQSQSEYQGKPQTTNWLAKEEYKPKGKDGKTFYPKQPDKVAMLKEAMVLTSEYINLKLKVAPKTVEELDKMIVETFGKVQGWCK